MTVTNAVNQISYTAAGTSGESFTVPFPFFANADIIVLEAGTAQVEDTDYTLTGAGDPTGTVTWIGTPTAAATIKIIRLVALTQTADYQETGDFPAESHEDALDKLTMAVQQSLQLDTTSGADYDAGKGLASPATTRKITNVTDPTAAQDAATKAFVDSQILSSGNVPTPVNPDDDGKVLQASAGSVSYEDVAVPVPTAGNVDYVLEATAAATYSWQYPNKPVNAILNGDFRLTQRGGTFTVPDESVAAYQLDRWVSMSQGASKYTVVRDTTTIPNGAAAAAKIVATAANSKMGILQPISRDDTKALLDAAASSVVSLSFEARTTSAKVVENLRVAILGWSGTADQPDITLVSAWNAEGADPTLTTNWEYFNTPADLALVAGTWTRYEVENITIDNASITNLAVFIWVDDADAAINDEFHVSKVQLERGPRARAYQFRSTEQERQMCLGYHQQSYADGTAPATAADPGMVVNRALAAYGGGELCCSVSFAQRMIKAPAVSVYSTDSGTVDLLYNLTATADEDASAAHISAQGFTLQYDDTTAAPSLNDELRFQWAADAELHA